MNAKKIHILVTLALREQLLERLQEISQQLEIHMHPARKVEDVPDELWGQAEVLYTNGPIPTAERAPNLRWIQFHWAGVNDLLEAPILHQSNVQATTLSGAAATQLAEYVVMMLLALGHRLPDLYTNQKKAEWPVDRWERFLPAELRDSTVGIVGYGSIGRQVARLLQPFGARIVACKRDARHPEDSGYTVSDQGDPEGAFLYRLYPVEALRSMFKECDFVVVTVPKTASTRHLIGAEELNALKPGAFLVDVSRGGIINQQALINALKEKRLAGAALDVFVEEPLPPENPLWKLPNVLLTPHISGNTAQYQARAVELFAANLQRYLAQEPLLNLIDLEKGY